MANVRKIEFHPASRQYYVIDTNFLVNKFIPLVVTAGPDRDRVTACHEWW
jgi:hypothetical protein